ncbi:NAD+ synthase [Novosphingobium pituita]|jgi:NAD+ synthase|uniref:Glutamine-dependent NAD(+) synthetase n=1 Tax=Novosphingobium pituita TaxID=3056842 RepID=A0ABQ6P8S2_9SPHN|nr:NAD+ synthase [Novosphingobium sp. IK01]MDK4807396.1 NAD+ synthase [Novosphingobium aromaticivorans]GMM61470.1 NAD+ synthase [Novosphingobium sp. IK01]HIQ18132.1 NAD+ synthase [Novosphingobium capsulatum]
MADKLIITLAQLNQKVGDLAANAAAMLATRSKAMHSDLIVFPEMQLIGYPPEDLILKPALIERAAVELEKMAQVTADGGPAMLVGSVFVRDGALHNGVALLDQGRIVATRFKYELPNYGTFDEKRLFLPGPLPEPVPFRGAILGLPICEDIWHPDVCRHLAQLGAEIFVCVNGSPYEIDKDVLRIDGVAKRRAIDTGIPLAYVNRVGGQDEIVFDGASFVVGPEGALWVQLPDWEEAVVDTVWNKVPFGHGHRWRCEAGDVADLAEHPEDIYAAMVMALRDYVNKNRFPGVLLGLSGGIDSALCAAIAVDALGAERVWCVMLPSRYTSQESLDDAAGCAQMLGVRLDTVPISPAVDGFTQMLAPLFEGRAPDLTEENLQSRIRGTTLMALSNKFGPMLVTTGNKSEMSVGYATIYGDMNGGYNPLKDAYKTTVFAISRWRNAHRPKIGLGPDGPVMPERVIAKPPSAELRPDQKDEDSLPPYDVLDAILLGLVEHEKSVDQIAAEGFERATVERIERLLHLAEYKRRQAPPGVKLGMRNFGRDRRYPITQGFRTA